MTQPRRTNEYTIPANELPSGLILGVNRLSSEMARTDDQRRREIDDVADRKVEVSTAAQIFRDQVLPAISSWDFYFVDTSIGSVMLTLPDVVESERKMLTVKKLSAAGTLTLRAAGGMIDGASTLAWTTQYQSYSLIAAGGNWWVY